MSLHTAIFQLSAHTRDSGADPRVRRRTVRQAGAPPGSRWPEEIAQKRSRRGDDVDRGARARPGEEVATDTSGKADSGRAPAAAEHEPDARYTFANERTFLAWMRTALALVAAGLAVIQ